VNFDRYIWRALSETFCEQLNPRIVFVLTWTVRRFASDQDDQRLSVRCFGEPGWGKRGEAEGEKTTEFHNGE
jgi:hypothetical protein